MQLAVQNKTKVIRQPSIPVQYQEAVTALTQCISIDEAIYWHDKSEALAAWAKMYHSDDAGRAAKRLKLHAYRRMGELAAEIRPSYVNNKGKGLKKGPLSLIKEHGFTHSTATKIRKIAKLPKDQFDEIVAQNNPPSPARLININLSKNPAWREVNMRLSSIRATLRKNDAKTMASCLRGDEVAPARELITEIVEWLDTFDRFLKE